MNILKIFFEEPNREFTVRDISRLSGVSPATASRTLVSIEKDGIAHQRKERMMKLFRAHIDSQIYRDMKLFYNIRKLRESGLMEELDKKYMKPTVVLYGSASFGMDAEASDFDIAVFSERHEIPMDTSALEKKIGRKLHIMVAKSPKSIRNPHLTNNILNGIVMQGEVKWT